MKQLDPKNRISVHKFSKSRYLSLKNKGADFWLVNNQEQSISVIALDRGEKQNEAIVEARYYDEYSKKEQTSIYSISQRTGSDRCYGHHNVFIVEGPKFEKNDLVVLERSNIAGRDIFFWCGCNDEGYYTHISAYSPYDDMHDSQVCFAHLMPQWHGDEYMRLATEKDEQDFCNALIEHERIWSDDGCFYYYPHVGSYYFEIFFEDGIATFRQCQLLKEEDRPKPSRLIMKCDMTISKDLREKRVTARVKAINESLRK